MAERTILAKSNVTSGIRKDTAIPEQLRRRAEILRAFKKTSKFDIIYYSVFVVFGFLCIGLFHKDWMTYLTVAELFCSLIVNNLMARGRISGIYVNFVDCILYGTICFLTKAYGEMVKTLIISNAFNIYGIISWSNTGKTTIQTKRKLKKAKENSKQKAVQINKSDELSVRSLSKKMSAIIYPAFAATCVAMYFVLNAFGTTMAYLGCITFTANIFIKYLSMARYREAWWFSLANNIVSIAMWLAILVLGITQSNDWSILPTLGGSIGGLATSINGLVVWNQLFRKTEINGGAYFAHRSVNVRKFTKVKRAYGHLTWKEENNQSSQTPEAIKIKKRIYIAAKQGLFHS